MWRVSLGAFDFGKDEAETPREAVDLLVKLLQSMQPYNFGQMLYEVDDLENDEQETFDLAEGE
jgi:hypothetical protein